MSLELKGFQSLGRTDVEPHKIDREGKINFTHIFFLNNNKIIEVNTTTIDLHLDGSATYKYIESELKDTLYGEKTIEPYTTIDGDVEEEECECECENGYEDHPDFCGC